MATPTGDLRFRGTTSRVTRCTQIEGTPKVDHLFHTFASRVMRCIPTVVTPRGALPCRGIPLAANLSGGPLRDKISKDGLSSSV